MTMMIYLTSMPVRMGLLAGAFALLGGCSMSLPVYQATSANAKALQSGGNNKVNVGSFSTKSDDLNHLSTRGTSQNSPYNDSYGTYLQMSLQSELIAAKRYTTSSNIVVSGELLENDLNAPVGTGTAHISARFTVMRPSGKVYDKVFSADQHWDSSFVAAIAFPEAQTGYMSTVNVLLNQLFADPEFETAIN